MSVGPCTRSRNRPLWIAISVLGASVVAMGASLIYLQTRPPVEVRAVVAPSAPVIQRDLAPGGTLQADVKQTGAGAAVIDEVEKPAAAPQESATKPAAQKAEVRAKPVATAKAAPVTAPVAKTQVAVKNPPVAASPSIRHGLRHCPALFCVSTDHGRCPNWSRKFANGSATSSASATARSIMATL